MTLFSPADVEAALIAFDHWDAEKMTAALNAAVASLEKRGGLFQGCVSYDGETGLPEVEVGPAFTTNQSPVAIIRIEEPKP